MQENFLTDRLKTKTSQVFSGLNNWNKFNHRTESYITQNQLGHDLDEIIGYSNIVAVCVNESGQIDDINVTEEKSKLIESLFGARVGIICPNYFNVSVFSVDQNFVLLVHTR